MQNLTDRILIQGSALKKHTPCSSPFQRLMGLFPLNEVWLCRGSEWLHGVLGVHKNTWAWCTFCWELTPWELCSVCGPIVDSVWLDFSTTSQNGDMEYQSDRFATKISTPSKKMHRDTNCGNLAIPRPICDLYLEILIWDSYNIQYHQSARGFRMGIFDSLICLLGQVFCGKDTSVASSKFLECLMALYFSVTYTLLLHCQVVWRSNP